MRATTIQLAQLAFAALQHRDALAEIAKAADYADRIAATADPARTAGARRLVHEAEAAEWLYEAIDSMAVAAEETLADAAEADAQHPAD